MSSDQIKAQLAEAKALIQQKRFADARKVLKRINDPTARQWEAKIDEIAPAASASSRPVMSYTVVGIVCLLIGLAIGSRLGNQSVPANTLQADYSRITDVKAALDNYCDVMKLALYCSDWTANTLSHHLDTARKCLTTIDWERNIESFGQCLLNNNVPLYLTSPPSQSELNATDMVTKNEALQTLMQNANTDIAAGDVEYSLTATAQSQEYDATYNAIETDQTSIP